MSTATKPAIVELLTRYFPQAVEFDDYSVATDPGYARITLSVSSTTGTKIWDFEERLHGYSMVIGAGKLLGTAGSYLLCTKIGAPVGLALKAAGFAISGGTWLVQEIDRLGRREDAYISNSWSALNRDSGGLKSIYLSRFEPLGFRGRQDAVQ